jgi:HK97 family phage major capsid protein
MTDTAVIERLKDKRLRAWNDMRGLLEVARAEDRALSAEETQRFAALEGEMKSAGDTMDVELRAAAFARVMDAPAPTLGVPTGEPITERDRATDDGYEDVFKRYLRRGFAGLRGDNLDMLERRNIANSKEYRDMGEASNSAGGYLVPPGFLSKITEVLKFYGGVRLVANAIETTSGQSLVWPVNDDTANAATIIGENTQVGESDLSFTQRTLSAFMWTTGAVRIGRALLQDSAFDLETVVGDRFAKRIGRGQNTAFTLGTGITGGLNGVTVGIQNAAAADPLSAGGASMTTVGTLLTLIHSVDAAYRQSGRCVFMMNDKSVGKVQGLLDANGRPVFVPAGTFGSIATGAVTKNLDLGGGVDTLLGYPIVVNNDLPDSASSGAAAPVIFGDFKSGYIVRDVTASMAVLRLEERYADYGQTGFIGYVRGDGNTDDAAALRSLQNHA